jgi:HSP20 family protein
MALVKWRSPFDPIFPSIIDDSWFSNLPDLSSASGLNIYETDDAVVVEAAVPGVPEDNVQVSLEGNVLTISASFEEAQDEKDKKKIIYRSNRQSNFSYSTSLPRMVDASAAEAEVENGVVRITIPKLEEEKPKRIEVKKKV